MADTASVSMMRCVVDVMGCHVMSWVCGVGAIPGEE